MLAVCASVAVTHGCIIGSVLLYHPDGSEAKPALVQLC